MGRPTKPTALKLVEGTASRRSAQSGEPDPRLLDDLSPPAHLDANSAAVWRELAPMLRRNLLLTEADTIALEMLCDSIADYRLARSKRGTTFTTLSEKGNEALSQMAVAAQMFRKAAESGCAKFGMSPADRARVVVGAQGDLFGAGDKSGPGRFFG